LSRGLQALQLLEGAVIVALAGIDCPLVAHELAGSSGKGFAGCDNAAWALLFKELVADLFPNFGFGAAHAAEAPFVLNEGFDEGVFGGIGREVLLVVFGGEVGKAFGGFLERNQGMGADAGLEGLGAGCRLALGGAGAGGFWRLAAFGRGLFGDCHEELSFKE